MTQDFRQPGPHSIQSKDPDPSPHTARPAPSLLATPESSRRLILMVLNGSALAFFVGGLWLLLGEPGWLPAEIAPLVGAAFILVAASDLAAVKVLKLVWSWRGSRA